MRTLNFYGFSNTPSSCEYEIGEIEDKVAILFYQKELAGTSITNMIEHLTIHVLAEDLPGTPPENIRVFEHYNPELNPIYEWAEVRFSDSGKIDEGKSILKKIVELVFPSGAPPRYYVDSPEWLKVSEQNIALLSNID
ncbi:hypothetical protein ACE02P_09570 [Shewanella bicestrii]